uniref:Uncharacterized protein n=1 Tax=Magnetococcus massalia (strain MO-1) TaxID=451514 RepID=A0A1S7LF20_MAGMO|nr:Conserved protein of unknown function [Candidatus Magnetococcus massalia]
MTADSEQQLDLPAMPCNGLGSCCITQLYEKIINPACLDDPSAPLFISKPAFSVCPHLVIVDWEGKRLSRLCKAMSHPEFKSTDCFNLMASLMKHTQFTTRVCELCLSDKYGLVEDQLHMLQTFNRHGKDKLEVVKVLSR